MKVASTMLPLTGEVACGSDLLHRRVEQGLDQLMFLQPLAKQPRRARIGHAPFGRQTQVAAEEIAAPDLVLDLFIGQVLQMLKKQ